MYQPEKWKNLLLSFSKNNPIKMFSYLISIAKIIVLLCVFQKIYLNLPPISPSVTYEVTDNISINNQLISF